MLELIDEIVEGRNDVMPSSCGFISRIAQTMNNKKRIA
jgi:hypothetical protein